MFSRFLSFTTISEGLGKCDAENVILFQIFFSNYEVLGRKIKETTLAGYLMKMIEHLGFTLLIIIRRINTFN